MQQARAPQTQPFGPEAFQQDKQTVLRWLGMAGFLVNSRGTTVMIDPLLDEFDMPVMIDFPIIAGAVPRLARCGAGHPQRQRPLQRADLPSAGTGHLRLSFHPLRRHVDADRRFSIDRSRHRRPFRRRPGEVEVTPADHAWQNDSPGAADRVFQPEDCWGFGSPLPTASCGRRATPG